MELKHNPKACERRQATADEFSRMTYPQRWGYERGMELTLWYRVGGVITFPPERWDPDQVVVLVQDA